MIEAYDRENELRHRLISFLEQSLGLPKGDYYSRLDLDGFLRMKSVLGDINNIFTLKVSLAFVHWVTARLSLDQETTNRILTQVLSTKPNANGYDIQLSDPIKLIAEVKCNIPINGGNVYGSAQKNGIAKDIDALINGKSKSSITPGGYYKFIVFLDRPEIREATKHFVKNMKAGKELITFAEEDASVESTEKIYVVYVKF